MKINKRIKWIVIVVVSILILGWILIPIIVKNYAINNSKELLGRQIAIDGLRMNFFTGNLFMTGFTMFEQDDAATFVSFDTLNVNIEPYQFLFNKKVVEQFYLQGLSVHVIQKDSTFNFDDLVAFHSADADTINHDPEDEETFKYILSNLELKDGRFVFEDLNINDTITIDDLSFFVPYISWDQEEDSNADIKFNLERGGYLESSVNMHPADGHYDATLTIDHLYLDPFLKRIQDYAEISSIEGFVNSQLNFKGNINEFEKTLTSGRFDVFDFAMKDNSAEEFLAAEKGSCVLQEINVFKSSYHLDSIYLQKPYLMFHLDSISNNIYRIFKLDSAYESSGTTEKAKDSTAQDNLYYAIDHFDIDSGVMDYTDNLTGEPFDYHLSEIQIQADSIYSDANWVEINADMLLNERGTLKALVGFDPVDYLDGELHISVEKFLLPDLNIYTNHYVGHTMVEGDMFYYSDSKLINGNIESENRLLIKQPSVNNTKSGLFALPLKFAMWLLKDKNGDVNLNVPVRGDLNDPEIDVWKLVWSTFKNKITKTAENPVSSLAPLVGADPKELQSLDFDYPDTLLTAAHVKQLNWLLELEKQKEGLSIDLEYLVDDELQKEALAGLGIEEQSDSLSIQTNDSLAKKPGLDVDLLSEKYSRARISGIRNYLDSIYADTRIKTTGRDSLQPQNTGAFPSFKIKFTLESETDSIP